MTGRVILAAALLQTGAWAQLQLLSYDGTTETPLAALYNAGSAAPGDTLNLRFRVKNLGAAAATVQTISVAGSGFKLTSPPLLPYTLASQNEVEFGVGFSPTGPGSYSAALSVNTVSSTIFATAVPAALVSFGLAQLATGATANFGQTQFGTTISQTFTLMNPNSVSVTENAITVTGAAFRGPTGVTTPLQLSAGGSATFQITFAPAVAGQAQGTVTIDQRSFGLTGLGLSPPLPKGTISVSSAAAVSSAQQMNVSVVLASASQVPGTGTLTMTFQPANGLPDDASIQFLSGARRSATVTISPGDTIAKIGGQTNFAFQTGTTAGTIVFTLTLPNSSNTYTLPIAPAVVGIDTTSGELRVSDLDVNISGFDNTHSISQLGFTFYDKSGNVVLPGMIRVPAPPEFANYFASNQAAGAFTMLATFPVTGDATQIGGVDVQISNAAGTATTQRITF